MGPLVAVVVVVLLGAPALVVWGAPRRDVLAVRRRAVSHAPLLTAWLTPSHRELPGGPSAASTARPLYVITDARERKE